MTRGFSAVTTDVTEVLDGFALGDNAPPIIITTKEIPAKKSLCFPFLVLLNTLTATGTIEVDYNSGPSKAAGLVPETADSSGNITWTWKVGTRTAPGSYPVIITVNGSTISETLTVN